MFRRLLTTSVCVRPHTLALVCVRPHTSSTPGCRCMAYTLDTHSHSHGRTQTDRDAGREERGERREARVHTERDRHRRERETDMHACDRQQGMARCTRPCHARVPVSLSRLSLSLATGDPNRCMPLPCLPPVHPCLLASSFRNRNRRARRGRGGKS